MTLKFEGPLFEWRGPAPFVYLAIPGPLSAEIRAVARTLTYGWGVIPVTVTLGKTRWTTSLFPKDGLYLIPVKQAVQKAEKVGLGSLVAVTASLG